MSDAKLTFQVSARAIKAGLCIVKNLGAENVPDYRLPDAVIITPCGHVVAVHPYILLVAPDAADKDETRPNILLGAKELNAFYKGRIVREGDHTLEYEIGRGTVSMDGARHFQSVSEGLMPDWKWLDRHQPTGMSDNPVAFTVSLLHLITRASHALGASVLVFQGDQDDLPWRVSVRSKDELSAHFTAMPCRA